MTLLIYITGGVLLSLLVQNCSGQAITDRPKEVALSQERFNFFDLELLKSLASSQNGNLLVSPASVKSALAMVLEGAGGQSAKELREALRLPDEEKAIRTQFKKYLTSLQVNMPGTKVESANQIFLSDAILPQSKYETILKTYYLSNIEKVDFTKPATAAQTVNRWVNMLTHGLIPSLVEPGSISESTKLMIANALYFKGKWKHAFDFDKTSMKCFYTEVNKCLDTYLMESINFYKFAYIPSLHAHAVELPYEGDKFSLLLLTPIKHNGIQQLVRDLTHVSLLTIVSSLQSTEILVSVPRFSIDYNDDLVQKLQELGIQEVFSSHADLSGMVQLGSSDLRITNVLHKAKIDVNEEGTEAAAATGTLVVPLMGTTIPKLIFNHPFLFFLRNTETGDILFAGRLSEPEAAKPPADVSPNEPNLSESPEGILTPKPVVNGGTSTVNTMNPVKPANSSSVNTIKPVVPASSINTVNPVGNTIKPAESAGSSLRSPASETSPITFYSPKRVNSDSDSNGSVSSGSSRFLTIQQRSAGNSASQLGVHNAGNVLPVPETTNNQKVPAPTQMNVAQFMTRSAAHYAFSTNSAQFVSTPNETPKDLTSKHRANQSEDDRIHFSS